DRLEPEVLDPVEEPLAGPEEYGGDVEREFIDDPGDERLSHGRSAARDVDAILASRLTRLRVCGLEALGDEVEARAALHLDRLAGMVGEHEDRRVVGRLGAPPSIPVLIPLAADRPEHVAAHDVGPARSHEPALCRRVGVVRALVAEVPAMDLPAALPQRILPALVRPGDEAVERDRHVAGAVRHRLLQVIAICKRRHRTVQLARALRVDGAGGIRGHRMTPPATLPERGPAPGRPALAWYQNWYHGGLSPAHSQDSGMPKARFGSGLLASRGD